LNFSGSLCVLGATAVNAFELFTADAEVAEIAQRKAKLRDYRNSSLNRSFSFFMKV